MNEPKFAFGIPTKVDVDAIDEKLGVPKVGDVIQYETLEEIVKLRRTANRFKSIMYAWRKRLEDKHNLILDAIPGKGLIVLDAVGRINRGASTYKAGLRRIGRSSDIARSTDRSELDDDMKRVCDHLVSVGASLVTQAAIEARRMKPKAPWAIEG